MTPQEKKRNDKLISIISLVLLVPFVIVVAVFLVGEIRLSTTTNFEEPDLVVREEPLSPAEVAAERASLPKTETQPELVESNTVIVTQLTEDDLAEQQETNLPTETFTANSQSEKVTFIGASASFPPTDDQPTVQALTGSVFVVNPETETFTLVTSNNQSYEVVTTRSTPIFINGQRIFITDLAVADLVRVEGLVERTSVTAQSVTVTGTLGINFSTR